MIVNAAGDLTMIQKLMPDRSEPEKKTGQGADLCVTYSSLLLLLLLLLIAVVVVVFFLFFVFVQTVDERVLQGF